MPRSNKSRMMSTRSYSRWESIPAPATSSTCCSATNTNLTSHHPLHGPENGGASRSNNSSAAAARTYSMPRKPIRKPSDRELCSAAATTATEGLLWLSSSSSSDRNVRPPQMMPMNSSSSRTMMMMKSDTALAKTVPELLEEALRIGDSICLVPVPVSTVPIAATRTEWWLVPDNKYNPNPLHSKIWNLMNKQATNQHQT
jgi:hypothetical protein